MDDVFVCGSYFLRGFPRTELYMDHRLGETGTADADACRDSFTIQSSLSKSLPLQCLPVSTSSSGLQKGFVLGFAVTLFMHIVYND